MKKFFSLVLALVMALSLTTVAWGVADKNTLPAAVDGVINLTANLTVDFAGEHVPALADGTVINGNGYTLTLNGNIGSYDTWAAITGKNLTINDLVVVNNLRSARAVFVLEGGSLNNVDVSGAGNVIHPTGTAAITLTGCDFTGFTSPAILTDNSEAAPVNMVDCTFEGTSYAIVVRNDDGSAVGCTFDAKVNLYAEDSAAGFTGNTFNERVKLYNDGDAISGNAFGTNGYIALETGVTDVDASGNYWGGSAPTDAQLGGATADSYATSVAADGTVSGLVATNDSSAKTWAGLYGKATTAGAVIVPVAVSYTKAVAPVYSEVDGTVTNQPSIAFYTCLDLSGKALVEVATLGAADYVIYNDADGKVVFKYLAEVDNVEYEGNAIPFTNFGKACGQYKDANYDKTATYYTFENVVYKAVETSATALMVNGKVVPVVAATGAVVPHIASYTYNDKFEVTAVKCGVCGAAATIVPNYASLPDAVKAVSANNVINGTMYFYWPAAAAGTTTDKVESAETFDAGIAMYVGMSVMAAAGSAVVLKKKD